MFNCVLRRYFPSRHEGDDTSGLSPLLIGRLNRCWHECVFKQHMYTRLLNFRESHCCLLRAKP
jgi:hypothetical protein